MKKRAHRYPRCEPRIIPLRQAAVYVGGKTNLTRLRDAGFVRPWKAKPHDVQFDIRDLDAAIDRIKSEGWPE